MNKEPLTIKQCRIGMLVWPTEASGHARYVSIKDKFVITGLIDDKEILVSDHEGNAKKIYFGKNYVTLPKWFHSLKNKPTILISEE